MSPYLPFLQAIRENPSNDRLRLVFADWLEENGEPERAEFIRVQVEAYPMLQGDPRRAVLLRREKDLLRQHRAAWLGPLADLEPTLRKSDRGTSRKVSDAKFSFFRGLLRVRLGPDSLPAPAVLSAPEWDWVEEFGWHSGWRGVAVLRFLTAAPLEWCPTLTLRGNPSRPFGEMEVAFLAATPRLAQITTLDLSSNYIGAQSALTLAASPHLAGLRALDVGGNHIGRLGAAALIASPHLGRLVSLGLRNNGISTADAAILADLPWLARLMVLGLEENTIQDDGSAALATSPHLAQLKSVNLRLNRIGNAGAAALAASPHLTQLTSLNLSWNDIGDAGAAALVASPHLGRLASLNLSRNQIDKDGSTAQALRDRFGTGVQL